MPLATHTAIARYYAVRDELIARAPAAWNDVVRLCLSVPAQITTDSFWEFGKDKPCWSNITVRVGRRIADDLALSPAFASHYTIASPAWKVHMIETGLSWKKQSNFRMTGDSVSQFIAGLAPGGLKSYPWRLFAIREFAQSWTNGPALHMAGTLIDNDFDFGQPGVHAWSSRFAKLAGRGWGATTVMHMLTDLGLGIKPDIHVRRSAVRAGFLAPEVPSDTPYADIDARGAALDPLVVGAVLAIAPHVQSRANPIAASALRELDKVLMEWSRQGLVRPLQ